MICHYEVYIQVLLYLYSFIILITAINYFILHLQGLIFIRVVEIVLKNILISSLRNILHLITLLLILITTTPPQAVRFTCIIIHLGSLKTAQVTRLMLQIHKLQHLNINSNRDHVFTVIEIMYLQ